MSQGGGTFDKYKRPIALMITSYNIVLILIIVKFPVYSLFYAKNTLKLQRHNNCIAHLSIFYVYLQVAILLYNYVIQKKHVYFSFGRKTYIYANKLSLP